jgi:hypothetical protein
MALVKRTSLSIPIYTGFGASPWNRGLKGLGGCGCGGGCGSCGSTGLSGLGQTSSLDQIIASAANWLGGFAQSQLPASAALPPQYGSTGALATSLTQWLPYIVGGIILYKLIK